MPLNAVAEGEVMAEFKVGDLVVLKSGSMRMCVEELGEDQTVHTVWCNEGVIGRDRFATALLNKWEYREDSSREGSDRPARRGKSFGGDREGGGRPYGDRSERAPRGKGDHDGGDRPPRKTGWDGKPRDKKYFRKDG